MKIGEAAAITGLTAGNNCRIVFMGKFLGETLLCLRG